MTRLGIVGEPGPELSSVAALTSVSPRRAGHWSAQCPEVRGVQLAQPHRHLQEAREPPLLVATVSRDVLWKHRETEPYLDLHGGRELARFQIRERPSALVDPPFRTADRMKTARGL